MTSVMTSVMTKGFNAFSLLNGLNIVRAKSREILKIIYTREINLLIHFSMLTN